MRYGIRFYKGILFFGTSKKNKHILSLLYLSLNIFAPFIVIKYFQNIEIYSKENDLPKHE